jgi:hypothetical protein
MFTIKAPRLIKGAGLGVVRLGDCCYSKCGAVTTSPGSKNRAPQGKSIIIGARYSMTNLVRNSALTKGQFFSARAKPG